MNFHVVVAIYNLLMPIAFVLSAPGYFIKMIRRGNFFSNFGQRFGIYSPQTRRQLFTDPPIWIHAVSVGEVLLAHKLIRALRQQRPGQALVLSCTTSTGYALACRHSDLGYTAIYSPFDLWGPVRRAYRRIRPRLLVLIEAELWPNLLWRAEAERVPVVLANARLSPRSERRFRKFAMLTRPMFGQLHRVMAQSETDVTRVEDLGVARKRIFATGSIKFDQEGLPDPTRQASEFGELLRKIRGTGNGEVILAGSTHPGEEKFLAQAFLKLRAKNPDVYLVVVPRHAERAAAVANDLRSIGFSPILKTDVKKAASQSDRETCLIVNTTGELRAWYYVASIVLIGKSFLAEGGQNPVEALVAGKPVIMGPHMENFAEFVERMVAAAACIQLSDASELAESLIQLAQDPARREALVENVREVLAPDQGAAKRSAGLVLELLAE